jgi:thiamine pyrophosphokinase
LSPVTDNPAVGRQAVIFGGAPLDPTPRLRSRVAELVQPFVVAADRGASTALAFGCQPDVVVGDLDSLDAHTLAELQRRGVPIETYPRDKDATDGQLALERALVVGPDLLLVLAYLGGPRLDQALANVLLLTQTRSRVVLLDARNECVLLREHEAWQWQPEATELISLLPIGGDAHGVRTGGLRWQLDGETLRFGSTRGLSNEPISNQAHVSVERGQLLLTRHFPLD